MEPAPRLFEDPSFHEQPAATKNRRKQYAPLDAQTLTEIWEFYVTTFSTGRGIKPRLTDDRTRLITKAVNEYGASTVKQAIRGCSLSDWHMGKNPSGKKYTSIELILRDAANIERFAGYAEGADTKGGSLDD